MADDKIKILEKRLEQLESKVFGDCDTDAEYPKESNEICGALVQMNSQVDSAIAGRPKIQGFMKRLSELERYLDPAYAEQLTLSNAAKAEIIMADEGLLREQEHNLEKVKEMSSVLSSEHLRVTPQQADKLHALSQVHVKQTDATSELSDDVKALLIHYNNCITLLSKQFIQWDETLTKLEAARSVKVSD